MTTVWAEIASGKVDADHAPGFTDRGQLLVGEISRMWAKSMRVGMRSDEGRIADSGNVPKSAFVEVRQVDQNLQAVAGPDQLLAKVCQPGSRIGRRGTEEWHAMRERIRPAPNGTEGAKSRLIQHVQKFEFQVDCFRTFDMKHRSQHAVLHAFLDIIDVAADTNAALRLPLNTQKKRHHREDSLLRRGQFNGRRQRGAAAADVLRRCVAIGANCPISRGDEDRKQPSSETTLARYREIQVALALTFEEGTGRVCAATPVETQQDIIVAVEERHTPRRFHQKCSVANFRSHPEGCMSSGSNLSDKNGMITIQISLG